MKFTLGWLKEHLDTTASLEEITDALTALGLELEGVEDRAKTYAPFKVAYVEKAEKHPDADRLKVCIVDTGTEKLQVVCGAPNARTGMKGVFAPDGSFIPGTGAVLKKGNIRGQESNGMLVSEREMGLSDEHDGIIDVPEAVPVGTPFADLYGFNDPVIDIAITPDRADCTGVRGVARDLAAKGLGTLKPINETAHKGSFKSPISVTLNTDVNGGACPHFIGRYIKGVKNGPSPEWLQTRLKAIGLRPISVLVDITNLFTHDLCRPLHVFDADKIKGHIHVRLAKKGETLKALNDKEYTLDDFMTAVCDDSGVLGLGGIIGGESTGCGDDTVNVFVEAAYFDTFRTAKTGRALDIISDARYRFERGIDPAFTTPGMEMATRLILDLCGGEASDIVVAGAAIDITKTIDFDPAYTKQLAGVDIPEARQVDILKSLGFAVNGNKVTTPSWRGDIDARADLVEEVARVNGYDNIQAVSVRAEGVPTAAETVSVFRSRMARTALAARGLYESVTWSFMPRALAAQFGSNDNAALTLSNPISTDLEQMRPSILPNLIEAAGRNADRGFGDTALFEVGPVFESVKVNGQKLCAAGVRHGHTGPRHWTGAQTNRAVDAFDAKADALAALEAAGAPTANLQVSRDAPGHYHPGRSGSLRLGSNVLGYFGDIHPAILDDMKISAAVCGFELFLDAIPDQKKKGTGKPLLALAPLQPVERDFAFIVDEQVEGDALLRAARSAEKNLITSASIFDVYQGKGVEPGKKSIALTIILQPKDQTLTDAEIDGIAKKIVDTVCSKTGATLRS